MRRSERPVVIHKGIEYTVSPTVDPDVWQWRFQIGDKVFTGKTKTRLAALAARRARLRIDAELKLRSSEDN
jgi:hypothetical protein